MISEDAKVKLAELIKESGASEENVLGGHQFLEKFPQFNAFSLNVLNDNLGATRLAPGTYAMKLKVFGEKYIVLNPFHPQQLVPYVSKGRAIIIAEATTKRSWAGEFLQLPASCCDLFTYRYRLPIMLLVAPNWTNI